MKKASAVKAHSILGASGASRWLACPGSVRLSAGAPKSTSMYAAEGTAAHELGETLLRGRKKALDYIGSTITVEGTAFTVTEEMAEAVQLYVDTVKADLKAAGKGATLMIEHRFHLDWLYEGLYGTNDSMVCQPFGLLRCYDLKYGAGVAVDAEDNAQALYYALGGAKDGDYSEVELVIVQPRAIHHDGPVRRCRMSIESLFNWGNEVLLPGAKATEDPNAPLSAGDHCRFCPALPLCPEQKSKAIAVAKSAFAEVPTPLPVPNSVPPAELKKILDAAPMVEAWLDACKRHVKECLERGTLKSEDVGYKLIAGRAGARKWKDEKTAGEWLEMLVEDAAYVPKALISPAAAEKLLKGDAKTALKELVDQAVSGVQLAPMSDKRPAVSKAVGFSVVTEDFLEV